MIREDQYKEMTDAEKIERLEDRLSQIYEDRHEPDKLYCHASDLSMFAPHRVRERRGQSAW